MPNLVFVLSLAVVFSVVFVWAFRHLPRERWQFIAAVPLKKNGDGTWHGVNLTYYGFFNANAYLAAVVTVFLLLGAAGVPASGILVFTFALLGVCVPASRLVARLVEKKRYTFSVAGAAFVGLLISPWLAWLADLTLGPRWGFQLPVTAAMAAISVAYAVGEGLGRLACISFGCCYGKPVAGLPPLIRLLLLGRAFTFEGKTKKIAYADHMDGRKVVPVQALTAVLFTAAGLIGLYCYLEGHFLCAFLIPLCTTQTWRFVSEFLRADYRGRGCVSAYQKMCLAAMLYAGIVAGAALASPPSAPPNLSAGLASLWRPSLILFLQGLWVFSFLYTGKSQVTDSHLSFGVRSDRI